MNALIRKLIAAAAISAGIASLTLLSVATPATPAHAQETDLVAIFEQFVDHLNAGELDGALALMTDDAFFPPDNVGKAAIREELENRKADNTQVTVINPRVVGHAVESEWTITSDCIRESGLGSFGGTTTIEFVDGKISADLPLLDLTDEQFVQLAEATVCTAAKGQTLPAAGSGGLAKDNDGPAIRFYALALAGALLVTAGVAMWHGQKNA